MKAKHYFDPNPEVAKELLKLNKKGDFVSLEKKLDEQLENFPNSSFLNNLKGSSLVNQNRLKESIPFFKLALDRAKKPEVILNNIGVTQIKLSNFEESLNSFNSSLDLNPNYAEAYCNLGTAQRKLGRTEEAVKSYEEAIKINPKYSKALLFKSLSLKNLGNFEESISCSKEAIRFRADYGIAHRHLTSMIKYSDEDDLHIKQMESIYEKELLDTEDRIHLAFGLGKAFEDVGNYKKAFKYLQEGNRLYRGTINYSTKSRTGFFNVMKQSFNKEFFDSYDSLKNKNSLGEKIIFVLGMPRSGTSLVEQILSSHSKVHGAGELRYLREAVDEGLPPKEGMSFPKNISLHNIDSFDVLGNEYLNLIKKLEIDPAKIVVDKMPYNFLHVGLIYCSLPKAKIILCEREPLDNCFSIYKQKFGIGNDFAYSLKEVGEYFNLYKDLIGHWESVLPGRMFKVGYESLIAKQEEISKNMIDFCGLDWEKECLTFHSTKREVNTASAVQVRKPIYKTSVNLWEKYRENLNPLIEELTIGEN